MHTSVRSIRHVLPAYGYFPNQPAAAPMSGITTVAYHLARDAAARGQDTALVTFSNGRDRMRFEIEGVSVRRIRPRRWLNLPRIDLSYAGPVGVLSSLTPVDVAHVHANPYLVARQRAKVRVLHYHSPVFSPIAAYRRAVARADQLVFCSEFIKAAFISIVGDIGRPMHVVPNGVALDRFADAEEQGRLLRAEWGVGPDDFLVAFAGNISHDKGTHVLVDAMSAARHRVTNRPVRLVVVGSSTLWRSASGAARVSDYETDLRRRADPSSVHFVGTLPRAKMPAAYAAADVLVCPSLYEEAFGLVVLEAMAAGTAVIASRSGGIPEVIDDGVTGLLVDRGDPAALAAAIAELAADPARLRRIGEAGRRKAQHYDWTTIGDTIQSLYGEPGVRRQAVDGVVPGFERRSA